MPPNGGAGHPPSSGGKPGEHREVIFEFTPVGGSVKVTAIDAATGTEVSVVGPAGPAAHRELERVALLKLQQRMMREGDEAHRPQPQKADPDKGGAGGGGIIV